MGWTDGDHVHHWTRDTSLLLQPPELINPTFSNQPVHRAVRKLFSPAGFAFLLVEHFQLIAQDQQWCQRSAPTLKQTKKTETLIGWSRSSGTDSLSQSEDVTHTRSCEDHTAQTVTIIVYSLVEPEKPF